MPDTQDELIAELVAAIEEAGRGYSILLTRLVDDDCTYTLIYRDERREFPSHEEASEYLACRARQEKIEAAERFLAAKPEPTPYPDLVLAGEAADKMCEDFGYDKNGAVWENFRKHLLDALKMKGQTHD